MIVADNSINYSFKADCRLASVNTVFHTNFLTSY